jgi:hypothetical protein
MLLPSSLASLKDPVVRLALASLTVRDVFPRVTSRLSASTMTRHMTILAVSSLMHQQLAREFCVRALIRRNTVHTADRIVGS